MNINSIHQSCNNDNEEELQINNESYYSLFYFYREIHITDQLCFHFGIILVATFFNL